MSALADACRHPFSNGTEGEAWTSKWCDHCARDHGMHLERQSIDRNTVDPRTMTPMCSLIGSTMFDPDGWPEGWLPEPDDGRFFLPSRIICSAFTPCEPCGGDPGAEERAERVAEVTAYWREREPK